MGRTVRYIALLRAINVGGKNIVKMEELRARFAELGLENVRSYIQSGNVFFDTEETDREALTRRIEDHLLATLGSEIGVYLRTLPEVEALLTLDPFRAVEVTPDVRLCVLFTDPKLPGDLDLPLVSPKQDIELHAVTDAELCYVMRVVNGRPSDPTSFFKATFGRPVRGTTRFFGTTAKILEAARKG
jgi:uncharacterized protein (DUF1697 family)